MDDEISANKQVKKIFLTWRTGFIGQPLTKSLLANGWHVTALVRNLNSPQARAIKKFGATLVQGDAINRKVLSEAGNAINNHRP